MTADSAALRDVTCVACGCLCDDLTITVREGRIVEAENACEIARRWFLSQPTLASHAIACVEGQAVDRSQAVARAAEILARAKAPVILGLSQTTSEAMAVAIAIADQIGAVVEVSAGLEAAQRLRAVQRIGRVSATLGEVKNRADVSVFWGVDPVVTHPRHLERYSSIARRFVPEGGWADRHRGRRHAGCHRRLRGEIIGGIRRSVRPSGRCGHCSGVPSIPLASACDRTPAGRPQNSRRLKGPTSGPSLKASAGIGGSAMWGGPGLVTTGRPYEVRGAALGGAGNVSGAEAVLTWQSGCAGGVDFSRGYPRSLAGETSALAMLERGEADAALIVSEGIPKGLSKAAEAYLEGIPRIVIAPTATFKTGQTVTLASAVLGSEAGGTVMRTDGIVLPLRPPLIPRFPTDREWLESIAAALNNRSRS